MEWTSVAFYFLKKEIIDMTLDYQIENATILPEKNKGKKCYTLDELMIMLEISRNTLMKLIRKNEFPYLKLGGVYRIPKESFDRWLDS